MRKVTLITLKGYFGKKMTEKLAENTPVYSFLSSIKIYQVSKACVIPFKFRKGKTGNLVVPSLEQNLVFGRIYSILGAEKPYILRLLSVIGERVGYHGWTEFCYVWLELD